MELNEIHRKLEQIQSEQAEQKQSIGSLRGKYDLLDHRVKSIEDIQHRVGELEKIGARNESELKAIRSDIDELKESGEQHAQMLTEISKQLTTITGRISAIAGLIALLVALAEIYSAIKDSIA